MLRELTWRQFWAWYSYSLVEPFSNDRLDWNSASICSIVANMAVAGRGGKKRFKVSDFVLGFGQPKQNEVKDEKEDGIVRQPSSHLKFMAQMAVALSNAEADKKAKRKRR